MKRTLARSSWWRWRLVSAALRHRGLGPGGRRQLERQPRLAQLLLAARGRRPRAPSSPSQPASPAYQQPAPTRPGWGGMMGGMLGGLLLGGLLGGLLFGDAAWAAASACSRS